MKFAFLPIWLNNQLFGEDNFEIQQNHNLLVMSNKQTLKERGARLVVMDFSQVESPIFVPNQDFKIDVAFEPFIKSPFWIYYEISCMLPTFFFIYKFVKSFVNHHHKV